MLIETLEGRRHFSVTVTVGYPGFYEISGTEDGDVIDVAVSQNDGTFTVDGQTYADATLIHVYGYGGDDQISVISPDGAGGICANVDGGDGDDRVVVNFDGAIWGGAGNDDLHLADAYSGEIYGGDGADLLYIGGASVDALVSGGSGADVLDATENWTGVTLDGGTGNDEIRGSAYNDDITGDCGNDTLFGNDGDDVFHVRDNEHDDINGGAGTDVAYSDSNDDGIVDVEWILVG
jgi:hypothetical protein